MRLSILTPYSKDMEDVLFEAQDEAFSTLGSIEFEWLSLDGDAESVPEHRQNLINWAKGDYILWWDVDDWIRPEWIVGALQDPPDYTWPYRSLRADVVNRGTQLSIPGEPTMAGGIVSTKLARQVPYPTDPADRTTSWWRKVGRRGTGWAYSSSPEAVDAVCTVHGRNLWAPLGLWTGPWSDVPQEALVHCKRVKEAVNDVS